MAAILPDVRAVVEHLGGVKATADMFGRTENAVWNWVATDKFPANTYVAIRKRLKARRKSAPDGLWSMAEVGAPAVAVQPARAGA